MNLISDSSKYAMNQTFKLYRLQQIDSQLDQINNRLAEINALLSDRTRLHRVEENVALVKEKLERERKVLRQAEEDVRSQRIKIEQTEATLYGGKVRNPKELQDLQNEAAALKRYLSVLEDRQLEAMIAVEDAESAMDQVANELERVSSAVHQENQTLSHEQANLTQEAERFSNEKQAACATISSEMLKNYTSLRQKRRGVAVARVSDKACAACGTILNAALLQATRSPNQITYCDTCGRILYGG